MIKIYVSLSLTPNRRVIDSSRRAFIFFSMKFEVLSTPPNSEMEVILTRFEEYAFFAILLAVRSTFHLFSHGACFSISCWLL